MAIDKSTRQHYAMQGKIRNYLGKQKMVKAPKKWKSGPDHPDTELAYITKAEKDLILKSDLHGSLSKGPNRGPSGIISLNGWGDAGDFGGGGGGGHRGGGADRDPPRRAPAPKPAPTRSRQESVAREEKAKAETISKNPIGGLDQFAKEVVALEDKYAPGRILGVKDLPGTLQDYYKNKVGVSPQSQFQVTAPTVHTDLASTISKNPIGGLDQFAKEVGLLEDKYPSGTKLGLGDLPGTLQDYYKNKVGVGPRSQFQVIDPQIKNPFEQQGARTAIPTTPPLRTRIQDERAEDIRKRALGNIALQTDKSLMDVSDPSGQRQGIMSGLADTGTKEGLMSAGKNYAKKAAINYGLQKLGLGFINPLMGLASLFGFKMPKGTGTKTAWQPDDSPGGDGGQGQGPAQDNVIQASIQKFSPEQADMMKQKYSQLQGVIDSGVYQGRQLTAEEIQMLQQKSLDIQKLMEQYLVDPKTMMAARGGIARLYG